MQARWHNRLTVMIKQEHNDVLVLKSEFNTAWNYFSARELGDTIIRYWRGWLAAAESGLLKGQYPDERDLEDLSEMPMDLLLHVPSTGGNWGIPDIWKVGIDKCKVLVSWKRTRNLFDLTSLWKKTVLTTLDNNALELEEVINLHRGSSPTNMEVDDPVALFNVLGYRQLL